MIPTAILSKWGRLCNMANFITGSRIIFSIVLLFCPALSPTFYGLYILAGFTDMIDGAVARKTDTVSVLGSRLDTVATFAAIQEGHFIRTGKEVS